MEIQIEKYLSEEEMKDIAIEEYKSLVREKLRSNKDKFNQEDYERVISNSVYHWLREEVERLIGADTESLIKGKVIQLLNEKSFDFHVFRKKGTFDAEDSKAYTYLQEAITENKHLIEDKVKEKLKEIPDSYFEDELQDLMTQIIKEKLNN